MKKYNANMYQLYKWQRHSLKAYFHAVSCNVHWQAQILETTALSGITPYAAQSKKMLHAAMEMSERLSRDYEKLPFQLGEEVIVNKDFGSLLHFKHDPQRNDPKVLIVAPMSGHHATLLREMVAQLLPSHDVYITDWQDARTIPLDKGEFGFEDYVTYVQDFIKTIGPDAHVVAISQSTVTTLAAIAVLAQEDSACQPLSMTLIGGPIDTRVAETAVTRLAKAKSLDWFAENMLARVPESYAGAGRLVYPGFLQLFSFMALNPAQHIFSHLNLFRHLAADDHAQAGKLKGFYDEYLAVCDLPGKFYLETVQKVFMDQELAKGTMTYRGKRLDLAAIRKTALLTVEGAKDTIVAPGQTFAAHKLCAGLQDSQRAHHLQKDADHYGIFSGDHWRDDICPKLTRFIRETAARHGTHHDAVYAQKSIPVKRRFGR